MYNDTELAIRHTPEDLLKFKASALLKLEQLSTLHQNIQDTFEEFHSYSPYTLTTNNNQFYGENQMEKYVDQQCWEYLIQLYELHKYMLCTEFEKLRKDINSGNFPVFNEQTLDTWMFSLKGMIKDNVTQLLKRVYDELINGTYYTGGSSWNNSIKKKRNNNGLDKTFILHTNDYHTIFGYCYNHSTITDDLEKICYILDGQKLPERTIKDAMKLDKKHEAENKYFKIKVCKNGNTHYTIFEETLKNLNKYCNNGTILGENIKIKVFERK